MPRDSTAADIAYEIDELQADLECWIKEYMRRGLTRAAGASAKHRCRNFLEQCR
jgi:hypothetical protein